LRMLEPRSTKPLDYLQTKPPNVLREFLARTHNLLFKISLGSGALEQTGIFQHLK